MSRFLSCSRFAHVLLLALLLAVVPAAFARGGSALKYAGVNLSGAEFNSSKKPGTLYKDYTYPKDTTYAYFAGKGMNIVRLPFLWERLQPEANGELDAAQLAQLKTAVSRAEANGQHLILDVHNYAKYNGERIGSSAVPISVFSDLWKRLADEFKDDDAVIFGLMNEPNGISSTAWAAAAQAAIDAIRATGAHNLILVPGTAYTGAHSWTNATAGGGVSNGDALAGIQDPDNRIAFEAHQYLDSDYSGTSGECVSSTVGADKLAAFTGWLRNNGKVGFLGEYAAGTGTTCQEALEGMLGYIEANADVWLGWTWWAGGEWWNTSYPFNVQPDADGSDKPQMAILAPHARRITSPR